MNFVATLRTDLGIIRNPAWSDVEREIGALDARDRTLVILAPPPPLGAPEGDHHLAVGGGGEGRFIVYTTEDNLLFWNLADPAKQGDERKVRMNIGGQEGEYRDAQFVSRELALRAARHYLEIGERAAGLVWKGLSTCPSTKSTVEGRPR